MSEVLQALEGPIAPMICASEDPLHAGTCERTGFCNVNLLWVRVRDAVVSALDSMTLADLATPRAAHPFHALPVQLERHGQPPSRHLSRSPTHDPDRRRRPCHRRQRPRQCAAVDDRQLVIRDLHVVPIADPTREILARHRPDRPQGRGPRDHGPQRLGQDDARLRADGTPRLHGDARARSSGRATTCSSCRPTSAPGWASSWPSSTRPPSPACRVASFLRTALNARRRGLEAPNEEIDPSDPTRGGIKMGEFRTLLRSKMFGISEIQRDLRIRRRSRIRRD